MKRRLIFKTIGCVLLSGILFTACIQRDNYEPAPSNNNNNYHNNNNSGYSYVFDEEFNGSDNYNWTFTSPTDSSYAGISNGNYQFVDYSISNYPNVVVGTNANLQGNFVVQTSIKSNNRMGLIFGASTTDNGYAFYVDSNGYYSLYKEGYGSVASSPIIPSTQDTLYATKKGWNTLEIDQISGNWTGFINGTQIFRMAARTISGSGFGFKIVPGTVGYADYIKVKNN